MKNFSLCQHWTRLLTKSMHHRFIFKCFKPYLSFFNKGRVFPSDTKKINSSFHSFLVFVMHAEALLFEGLIVIMHIFFFLSTHSHTKTSPSVSPRLKKIGPVLTKIVQEWDSFKSGSALRLTSFLVFSVDTASILQMFAPTIFTFHLPWFTFWEARPYTRPKSHITLRPCPLAPVDGNEGMGGKLVTELGNETRDLGFCRPLFNDFKKMIWALSQLPTSPIVTFLP